ncbi:MAG TPA: PBP1A family penicillin-binding protein [candidate division Zixibacteria bacterium]|nr:PBP1A family penicillin-binding protein [candidate division Zixibacteria bacterium]
MKRFKLRFVSAALLSLLVVTCAGIAFGSWYLKRLEQTVQAKFEGQKWRFPSKIYSDSYLLYVGMHLRQEEIWEKLRRLGYRETQGTPTRKGEYRYLKSKGVLELYLHDFVYPTEPFRGFPVRIFLNGGTVARIENATADHEMFSLELEPELVTGLYDRIWEERRVVSLSEVPPLLVKAILAVEDERFYKHHGIDPVSILRALWVNLRSGAVVQGGSTLTQQLMKNFFLGSERTLSRKVKEALMALIAERKYSKAEILENYLNEIYLGQRGSQGIFGVWEASQFYFSKPLSDLTVGEMALLAGLIRAPNALSPYRSLDVATKRRNVVLAKMLDDKIITRRQYEAAVRERLPRRELVKITNDAPFYVDFLRRELAENYSNETLTAEGMRIFTSLDLQLQRFAEKALSEGLSRLEETYPSLRRRGEDDHLEGAMVVIRPQTGEIKAMVGGRNYQKSQFNRVWQAKRQPGSIFKPFVYLAALIYGSDNGGRRFTPVTKVEDAPFTWSYEGQEWQPGNYNDEFFGTVTFRRGLEKSLNAATARIARDVGIQRVRDVARRLGIQSPLPSVPSLALGAAEVSPLEVAVAFATLANNGVRTRPLAVKQVMDAEGRVLEKRDVRVEKVISPQHAFLMNHLLKGVLDRGTGELARRWGFNRPAAGKTGTTNDYKDAWFVGYTPDLLAVVWVGFDNQSKLGLSGAQAALPIWTEFMKRATAGMPVTDFVPPPGVKLVDIDPISGQIATANCPSTIREAFLEGEEPVATCPLHPGDSLQISHAW